METDQTAKSKSDTIRIVLVDDNVLFCAGIQSLLAAERNFAIAGTAGEIDLAKNLIMKKRPHVILLNLELKQGQGLQTIPGLISASKTSRLAVLTDSRDPEVHRELLSGGVIGIISKQETPKLLKEAIKKIHAGAVWLDRFVSAEMLGDLSGRQSGGNGLKAAYLTKREREVVKMVGRGLKNKQIADRLYISDVTVHHHLTSIYSKLDVANRLELIVYAYKNRLAEVPR